MDLHFFVDEQRVLCVIGGFVFNVLYLSYKKRKRWPYFQFLVIDHNRVDQCLVTHVHTHDTRWSGALVDYTGHRLIKTS